MDFFSVILEVYGVECGILMHALAEKMSRYLGVVREYYSNTGQEHVPQFSLSNEVPAQLKFLFDTNATETRDYVS